MNLIERLLARRYAVALMRVCGDDFTVDTQVAMKQAIAFFKEHKPALYFLGLPDFPVHEKNVIIHKLLETVKLPECFHALVKLLGEHKRLRLIMPVLLATLALYQDRHGIMDVTVTSADVLQDAQKNIVQQFLAEKIDKKLQYTFQVEEDLIAGIRIQSNTLLWEYSVRKKLRALRLAVLR